jgi:hypothetical protein
MASAHSLDGLLKFLRRDEWRDEFKELLEHHLQPACDQFDIEIDDIGSLLGADAFITLWGAAFEDFASRTLDDNRNIIDDYLKRRSFKESATNKAYMRALQSSVMSLYEASEIVPGESFMARDLIRGGDPVRVSERTATRSLCRWDRIGARIMQVGSTYQMGGGVLPFDFETAEGLPDAFHRMRERAKPEMERLAGELRLEIDDPRVAKMLSQGALIEFAAPIFSTVWLSAALKKALNPGLPDLQNSDGDVLLWCTVRFPMRSKATTAAVRKSLESISELHRESTSEFTWLGPSSSGAGASRPGHSGIKPVSSRGDGATILGSLKLSKGEVVLTTNSLERAERGRQMIAEALGDLADEPTTETQTPEELMASRSPRERKRQEERLAPEDERAIVHATFDAHYRKTLGEPVGMLGGMTPREAAKSPAGREKIVAWLKYIENHGARCVGGNDAMASYDIGWLWKELGVADRRA